MRALAIHVHGIHRLARGDEEPIPAWAAKAEVWPEAAEQRCWNHKIINVLDQLPKKLHAEAKQVLATLLAYGVFLLIVGLAWVARGKIFRGA